MAFAGLTTLVVSVALLASCASDGCEESPAPDADCPDLVYQGSSYVEWREVTPPAIRQELGDATYPACNTAGTCADSGVGSNGATDVWLVEGIDPGRAVIGLREGTDTFVLFVERDTDPDVVQRHLDPKLLD